MINSSTTLRVPQTAEVTLMNGTVISGQLFVEEGSRAQDMLNDERPFFPLITAENEIFLLNKSNLIKVRVFD